MAIMLIVVLKCFKENLLKILIFKNLTFLTDSITYLSKNSRGKHDCRKCMLISGTILWILKPWHTPSAVLKSDYSLEFTSGWFQNGTLGPRPVGVNCACFDTTSPAMKA